MMGRCKQDYTRTGTRLMFDHTENLKNTQRSSNNTENFRARHNKQRFIDASSLTDARRPVLNGNISARAFCLAKRQLPLMITATTRSRRKEPLPIPQSHTLMSSARASNCARSCRDFISIPWLQSCTVEQVSVLRSFTEPFAAWKEKDARSSSYNLTRWFPHIVQTEK